MALMIGDISVPARVLLAPMSGISDLPFRQAAEREGARYLVSEMVASEDLARSRPDVVLRAALDEGEGLKVIQLAGREPCWMAEGAKIAEDLGADIIDINMGCPARKVTGLASGSALMRDLDLAERLIQATVGATSRPVTLKMRLGWDWRSLNAGELAQRAEAAGVKMLTIHGRTRCDFYKGQADWQAVGDVVDRTGLPAVVNGDIASAEDARLALAQSGADAVMIGRAAMGRLWLAPALERALETGGDVVMPSFTARGVMALEHYRAIIAHYQKGHGEGEARGIDLGMRMARKHLAALIDATPEFSAAEAKAAKTALCTSNDPHEVADHLQRLFGAARENMAA
ncbi:MAG: tRNA dihydrouridine synthase DusB [Pseudomonadota bacterium]